VFFTSRARAGGSSDTIWSVDFASNPPRLLWSTPIGNVDGSAVLVGSVLYVGTNAGTLYALDAGSGTVNWSLPLGDGAIKGFVFPYLAGGNLFLSTGTKIWSVSLAGWPVSSIPSPSTPIVVPGAADVLVGGGDGQLYQLDMVSPTPPTGIVLGEGTAAVGVPALDLLNSMIYVGTDEGVIYGVQPLP
jgi:outer membrane protein assembly factor BamB